MLHRWPAKPAVLGTVLGDSLMDNFVHVYDVFPPDKKFDMTTAIIRRHLVFKS